MAAGLDPDPLYARYPFLSGAREAVDRAGVDLAAVIDGEPAVVERARARVSAAVEAGTVGEPHRSARVELLSYPVARVLVSLVGEDALVERYARAEAATARERFVADLEDDAELRSVARRALDLDTLLAELDLAVDVARTGDGLAVAVGRYLALAADIDGPGWRLVARRLRDGAVPVSREELHRLVEAAVADRVAEGLPLPVPESVAGPLEEPAAEVRAALADLDVAADLDAVVPALFPPCVRALLERARDGEDLPDHSRFALAAFLVSVGLDPTEAVDLADVPPEREAILRYQAEPLAGDGGPAQYAPPSCATMQAYGDCVNRDEVCARIAHPLEYYETRLEEADGYEDWREVSQ